MKKTIIILSAILFFFSAQAQKDSTKDTVLVLTVPQANELISDIQIQASGKADVKAEQWNKDLQMLYKSVRIIPKEEQNTTK